MLFSAGMASPFDIVLVFCFAVLTRYDNFSIFKSFESFLTNWEKKDLNLQPRDVSPSLYH